MWNSTVMQAYDGVWGAFAAACHKANVEVKPSRRTDAIRCTNHARILNASHLSCLVSLRCKLRGGQTNQVIHVLVRATETLAPDKITIASSRVTVSYFEVEKNDAHLLQSIHYDFEGEIQKAHPWFHAQLCRDLFEDAERQQLGWAFNVKKDGVRPAKTLRIPTAHVGLVSVLLGLAADHFAPEFFAEFAHQARKQLASLPHAAFARMSDRLKGAPLNFLSLHWFEESDPTPLPDLPPPASPGMKARSKRR